MSKPPYIHDVAALPKRGPWPGTLRYCVMDGMENATTGTTAGEQHGARGELYGHLRNRDLLLRAATAIGVSLTGLLFTLAPADFALLYLIQLGLAMVVTAPIMFNADMDAATWRTRLANVATAVAVMAVSWTLLVVVPVFATWIGPSVAPGEALLPAMARLPSLEWHGLLAPIAALAILAVVRGRTYAVASRNGVAPDLKRPFMHRVLCVAAFVFFGPSIYGAITLVGSAVPALAEPTNAIVLTYALCEAYPFLATLFDRIRG